VLTGLRCPFAAAARAPPGFATPSVIASLVDNNRRKHLSMMTREEIRIELGRSEDLIYSLLSNSRLSSRPA
jgi:hypothetical protein